MAIRACDFYSLADRAHDLVGEVMRMMRAGKAIACAEEEINRVGGWTRPSVGHALANLLLNSAIAGKSRRPQIGATRPARAWRRQPQRDRPSFQL